MLNANKIGIMANTNRRPLTKKETQAAERIKRIWLKNKKKLGLSQDRAAEALGWSQGIFNKYLNGIQPLNLKAVLKFSELLGVSASELAPEITGNYSENIDSLQESLSDGLTPQNKVFMNLIIEMLSDFPEAELRYIFKMIELRKKFINEYSQAQSGYLIPEGNPVAGETTILSNSNSKKKAV